ncbi:uncharacterized protein LOC116738695 [Nasonia vitripennis]|uniref:Uncharacterized protein n=1 Tax=Nasonia vitripennis TaxID=7425 RepID=A0A7M7R5T7_NASVI|nr:uncharacterized protein LOC116738695 [Nasonia vitripennis]
MIRQARKSTNLRLRQHLVQALLFPIIDYCSLAYCDLTQELDLRLQWLVNTGIRYIYGVRRDEHISPYRRELQWLTTAGRRKYFMACFLRKMFNTSVPIYLLAYFDFHVALRPVRGEVTPLDIPSFRTETLRNSFFISASSLWNSLPFSQHTIHITL